MTRPVYTETLGEAKKYESIFVYGTPVGISDDVKLIENARKAHGALVVCETGQLFFTVHGEDPNVKQEVGMLLFQDQILRLKTSGEVENFKCVSRTGERQKVRITTFF